MRKHRSLWLLLVLVVTASSCTNSGKISRISLGVAMGEYKILAERTTLPEGELVLNAVNRGQTNHELVVIKTSLGATKLPLDPKPVYNEKIVDKGAPALKVIGEIEEWPPPETRRQSFFLVPGKYVLICDIPGHYRKGMRTSLTVL